MASFLTLLNGIATLVQAATAGGAPNANKVPQLDANGRLTQDMMPSGIGADSVALTASEALAAGDFVNVYNNGGAFAVRKADASSSAKFANGYVTAAVVSGGTATVFTDDINDQLTSQTAGDVFLSATTPGKTTSVSPTAAGQISQKLGFSVSATTVKVEIQQYYVLS